jgi:hypothetical protein
MYQISSDLETGVLKISDKFNISSSTYSVDATPYLMNINEEYILSFTNIKNVKKITKFKYDTLGLNDLRFVIPYYRISRDGNNWTEWLDLKRYVDNFPLIDAKDPLYLDIKWVRKGTSSIGTIRILEYEIEGELERDEVPAGDGINILPGKTQIIKSPFIFKVFSIVDIEIISSTTTILDSVKIKYRYSQDSERTWSNWELLTKQNISTKNINPIRFFQIEYSVENGSSSTIYIQDINLIGDFQNVSEDYKKTNLFGIRECCQSNQYGAYDANGNFIPNTNLNQTGGGPTCETNQFPKMTTDEKALLFNPYAQNTAMNLLEKLSADAQQMFGHKVTYFVTDADKKGQDHTLNEYALYNVVCWADIKVSVNENNFPDSQIVMNQFDLNLFETMEVHITKQVFKDVFGVQRRPSKEDFLYFCNLNRMYQVDHAQQFRNFNNAAVYYKLILKKYTQKANVQAGTIEIKNKLEELTKNSTIDELLGVEKTNDKLAVANKDQLQPLTREPIRLEYTATIDKELIENSTTIISKSNYDLSSVEYRNPAVRYKNLNPRFDVYNNVGFSIWFSIKNYINGEIYNLFHFYDDTTATGWKSELYNDSIYITMNTFTYSFDLSGVPTSDNVALEEETWYCYVLNLDQRNKSMEQFIYKRNVEEESEAANLTSNLLSKVYSKREDITPIQFQTNNGPKILASDMKVTNIRYFTDIMPENIHNKILNQYIIGEDSKYLVFADNATTRLYLPKYPLFE